MSIVWEQVQGGTRYQVRRAGGSLRLYTNGVLHSQYNAARPLTGSVWDLLTVPAFLLAPGAVQRVLVLGIGGGAVIQQLRRFRMLLLHLPQQRIDIGSLVHGLRQFL